MSTNKKKKAKQNLLKKIKRLFKIDFKKPIQKLLHSWVVSLRQRPQAGFVLPTVVLVLLVVGLTVGALLFRSLSQTTQVIGQREQQKIYNAATPAIDRAKSKLEYLFTNGSLPSGVPSESQLATLMNATSYDLPGKTPAQVETRLDLDNNPATKENAWSYQDVNGNTIAYSILMKTEDKTVTPALNVNTSNLAAKANKLIVRSGPLSGVQQISSSCTTTGGGLEQGWFKDAASTGILRKNFQVNAVVLDNGIDPNTGQPLNNSLLNKTAATLELQQDRQLDRGNKWGAWFLNDLEIHPYPPFNWNGSLHTEGSIALGYNQNPTAFKAFLISSPSSCLYGTNGLEASEISMNIVNDPVTGAVTYQGQMVAGSTEENTFIATGASIDSSPSTSTPLTKTNDSVKETAVTPNKTVVDVTMDPLTLFTEEKQVARRVGDPSNTTAREPVWDSTNILSTGATQRVFNKAVTKPYIDDTYRADNRYGPKLPKGGLPTGTKVGDPTTDIALVSSDPIVANSNTDVGLDGYWERRARNEGLRIIVGERLELGNPLAIPALGATETRPNETLSRRASRDNLAAVQATAIYFHDGTLGNLPNAGDVPVACLSTTVHPGTAETLRNSATFEGLTYTNASGTASAPKVFNDFFTGNGTNGWEYNFNYTTGSPSTAQLKALNNLAYFAGDPLGAYPAQQEISTSNIVHPYPEMTRNGNFSNLRRALASGVGYSNLSMADKSYIDTASCTLGMIADQIETLEAYDYSKNIGAATSQQLDELSISTALLAAPSGNPQAAIASLSTANPKLAQLARLVYLKEQVKWDRLVPGAAIPAPDPALTVNLLKLRPTTQTPSSALYYVFPTLNHGEGRTDPNSYITSATVNNTLIANPNLYKTINSTDLADISFSPRDTPTTGTGNLDNLDVSTATDPVNGGTYSANATANTNVPNHKQFGLIRYIDRYSANPYSVYRIPFKDTALFNGRELMNVRVLNIDFDLLRRTSATANTLVTSSIPTPVVDTWLPASGLIYAFREDSVREDGIARPALGTWANYKSVWAANIPIYGPPITATGTPSQIWRMNAVTLKDPPINGFLNTAVGATNGTGISPKSIDFYPDPMRRPYGFRLKQGRDLTRTGVDNTNGLSFISDNPTYIQGDFNLHKNSGGTRLEEFSDILAYTSGYYNNFYSRNNLDPSFAKPALDSWRPTEILVDATTILSDNFCDGSLIDGFPVGSAPTTVNQVPYGCGSGSIATSYLNQNLATNNSTAWSKENPSDPSSPVVVDNNGYPRTGTGTAYTGPYNTCSTAACRPMDQTPTNTFINTVMVSGSIPSRQYQGYGGLHNYPRFIENWQSLYLSGSFIQLKFSNYATAPWDQDAFENLGTNGDPDSGETLPYYNAPNRRWGYDVALQYQPPGPVAQRFTTLSSTRSEFYKELPVDDPYIKKLRCATKGATTTKVDLNATCP